MLQIKLKPKAEEDLETIFDYGANSFGFALASEYIHNLDEAFKLLANSPRLGMKQDVIAKGLRSFQVSSHFIFFRFNEAELTIVRVLHKTMLFKKHLS